MSLSPILFNMYLNDLLTEVDKGKTHSVHKDKTHSGLQRFLDILNRFCNTWNMKVNIEKTKCITFQKKNKVIRMILST